MRGGHGRARLGRRGEQAGPRPEMIVDDGLGHAGVLGKPAEALCKVGDSVKAGQLIAEIPEGALGARVHASITGTVESVGDSIRIRRQAT